MKKNNHNFFPQWITCLLLSFAILPGCKKDLEPAPAASESMGSIHDVNNYNHFNQVNLVSNNAQYGATRIDPALVNGWGIAFSAGGVAWIGSQGGHVSTVYNSEGATVLGPVNIPSPGGPTGGNPTGVIFNPVAADFIIPSGNAAPPTGGRFIFVGVDGMVSAWNPTWGNNSYAKFNHSATSAYTGLTLANNGGTNFLYAADFRAGRIAVWDRNWNPVTMSFTDPGIPSGYSPFNIEKIGTELFVTYAKVGPDGRSEAGKGKGYVSVFTTSGNFVKRFASNDKLNAPWGIAMAPASFFGAGMTDDSRGNPEPAILVGNFGDGQIQVYGLDGKLLGQLRDRNKRIVIDGLWAITFPPSTSTIDPNRLYFAAGPNHEMDGLFGYLVKE